MLMDVFVRVDPSLPSIERDYPAVIVVEDACCVPVRTCYNYSNPQ